MEQITPTYLSVEKKWAIACYIPVFNIVASIFASIKMVGSKFCLFHARQGIVLFGLFLFTFLLSMFDLTYVWSLRLSGVSLLLHGAGIYIAFRGNQTGIPIIVDFAGKIPPYLIYEKLTGKKYQEGVSDIPVDNNVDKGNNGSTN